MSLSPSVYRKNEPSGASVHKYAVLITIALTLLLLPTLSRGGLSGFDDALYAHEAKEMLTRGDWWTVHFNGALNFEYPPMFLWLEALSMSIFGPSDFSAKLPAALAGIGTVVFLYLLVVELTSDGWCGIFSMLVLATTQPFLKYATHAMTDVPFAFFFTWALWFYVKGLQNPRFLILVGFPLGAAILTRSILGLLVVAIIVFHLIVSRRWHVLWSSQAIGGMVIASLFPLAWGGGQWYMHGMEFLQGHFAFIFNKITTSGAWKPRLQIIPYLKELLKYYWPWLPIFISGIVLECRLNRTSWLAPIWLVLVLGPLTQAETAYGRYLIPAFPSMAVLCAIALGQWIAAQHRRAAIYIGVSLLTLAASLTFLIPPPERGMDIRAVAPFAREYSHKGQRIVLYVGGGETRYDYYNQLLWYSDRYVDHITDISELRQKNSPGAIGVIDANSFSKLQHLFKSVQVLARSELFVCYKVTS